MLGKAAGEALCLGPGTGGRPAALSEQRGDPRPARGFGDAALGCGATKPGSGRVGACALARLLLAALGLSPPWSSRGPGTGSKSRVEAETNFDMAQKAVEDYLTNVSENTLLKEQDSVDIRSLRQDLLKSALTYYEQFAAPAEKRPAAAPATGQGLLSRRSDHPGNRLEGAGDGRVPLGPGHLGPLVEANPKEHELAGNLAEAYLAMGKLESSTATSPPRSSSSSARSAILERLCAREPERAAVPGDPGRLLLRNRHRAGEAGQAGREPGYP